MHIYFSGIGGIGLSALAHMAVDAGYTISGSDLNIDSSVVENLKARGANISHDQSGDFFSKQHHRQQIDWLIYSGAIPSDNDERRLAVEKQIKQSKRDRFIHHLLKKYNLQLLAVSGTNGKTTATAMTAWALSKKIDVSWLIGSEITFGHHGKLSATSQWLIFEADEYDKLMLEFKPKLSMIPTIDYDHPDIYPTRDDYNQAFRDFINQSKMSVGWLRDAQKLELTDDYPFYALETPQLAFDDLPLLGEHNRANAELVACSLELAELMPAEQALRYMEDFPGTSRRFERINSNLISDYAHHPEAIKSTVELAGEYRHKLNLNKIIVVYQPHQDKRQRDVKSDYEHCFDGVDQIYWLPTYDPPGRQHGKPLSADELVSELANPDIASVAELDNQLMTAIEAHLDNNDLVVVMGAGSVDGFIRAHFKNSQANN